MKKSNVHRMENRFKFFGKGKCALCVKAVLVAFRVQVCGSVMLCLFGSGKGVMVKVNFFAGCERSLFRFLFFFKFLKIDKSAVFWAEVRGLYYLPVVSRNCASHI